MKKLDLYLCDRCCKVLDNEIVFSEQFKEKGLLFFSKKKHTKMHFCDERCKLIFFKGRKYYARKKKLEQEAFIKLQKDSEKCL